MSEVSSGPPRSAVLPSPDSATDQPWRTLNCPGDDPLPTSLAPCCVQTPLARVNTQAAPILPLSYGAPRIAVLPSAESEIDVPWPTQRGGLQTAPLPTSFCPCCVQLPLL